MKYIIMRQDEILITNEGAFRYDEKRQMLVIVPFEDDDLTMNLGGGNTDPTKEK